MGILSALHRLRINSNREHEDSSFIVLFIYSFYPWVSEPVENEDGLTEHCMRVREKKHGRLVDIISLTHITLSLLISPILSKYTDHPWNACLNWALQLLCVNSLLTVVDGLTRDGGFSVLSRVCRARPLQQLGCQRRFHYHDQSVTWLCILFP